MKKTLISTAVAFALGAPMSVYAAPVDDQLAGNVDQAVANNGAYTEGALSPSINSASASYNPKNTDSGNVSITNGFNDVNSNNLTTIGEDGIVAHANDLNQAVASNDFNQSVLGNLVVVDSSYTEGALSPSINSISKISRTDSNEISAGSFNSYSGIATSGQNIGSATAVQQSVVVQSNGGV